MAFMGPIEQGRNFEPGYFLESNVSIVRFTRMLTQDMATEIGSKKIVKMGTIWPSNDENAEGIVYEDIDVTWGDAEGSVVFAASGKIYESRLPEELDTDAKTALETAGFKFTDDVPPVTRPY